MSIWTAKAGVFSFVVLAGFAAANPLYAGSISVSGQVTLETGDALAGAMATITDSRGVSVTTYTDPNGRWSLSEDELIEPLTLRIRAGAAFKDRYAALNPGVNEPIDSVIYRIEDARKVSDRLTASAHVAAINWNNHETRQDFISQCHFCHQIGNEHTRTQRTEEEWVDTIKRMEGMGSVITLQNRKDFAATLSREFNGEPVKTIRSIEMHDGLPGTVFKEWAFGESLNYVHDIEIAQNGLIYGVDMGTDKIWVLDRKTNEVDFIQWEPNNLPLGGMFSGAVAPLGTFEAHHGPHSIIEGPDGKLYTTNSLASEIGILDPKTGETEFVEIGRDSVYPHTLRFDQKGVLWFTLALSNQIGRMDIKTREITLIETPSNGFWRWMSDLLLPWILEIASWFGKEDMHLTLSHHQVTGQGRNVLNLPYGIDVNPIDGTIWYSKLYAGYIGRLDPKTLEVTEWKSPYPAPRRMRFSKDGILWIPSFEAGQLMKFNPKTEAFEHSYKLPVLAEGEYETPYAVGVHPKDQHIWIASNMSDRVLRFDPENETFTAYPSPTRVTFLRDFIFTPEGDVCSSNANLPSYAIEGGQAKLLCITPADYK